MGKQQKMQSFFKRKRDEEAAEHTSAPDALALVVFVHQRQDETGQENHMQDEEGQENHVSQDGEEEEQQGSAPVIFGGIESLVRDPALRPQVWQYPPNQRDDVRRAYLRLGPMQPKLNKYKATGIQGQKRRFQHSYFGHFPSWLEYSVSSGRAYCLFCFLFSKNIKKRGGFDVFTTHGFDRWKKVHDGKKCAFLTHMGSNPCSQHNNAVRDSQALLNQPNHLANILEVKSKEEKEKDRLRLKTAIACVRWLTFQSCALRGHDEKPGSRNRGNFLEMEKLLGEFCPDIAAVIDGNAPQVCKWNSHEIQNEILGIYAMKVREHIRAEIGDFKYSILVDETCDVSKREQMALVFRFVDKHGCLQERFFHLIHVANTKSLTLKRELCSVLSKHGFDVQNMRGQGYDGASNMKGELNGLQALFIKDCPYAYYVHCYAHRLQLALVGAAKDVVPVTQFFQKLLFIINTVDSSSKRHDELHDAQVDEIARLLAIDEIDTGKGANQICSLKRPGDTRWGTHLGSVSSLMHMFNSVRVVLEKLGGDASAGANRADGDTAFTYLTDFEFVFVLCLMRDILETSEDLGKALQSKKQDIVNAVRLVHSTKVLLEDMRSDEGWDTFILTVIEFCVEHGIDIPDMDATYILRGGRSRRQPDHFTTERYLRVEIYRAAIDSQLTELNFRFNEKVMDLLSISVTLIPRNGFRSFSAKEICSMVEKYYPADFTQQERYGLELQLRRFVVDAKNNKELRKPLTITSLCRCLVKTGRDRIYNWIDRLLRLLVTLPVSTATAERAFSTLKIIKSRLRNRMEDDYLADSMLVQIERGIALKISYDDVITEFKATKNRRGFL